MAQDCLRQYEAIAADRKYRHFLRIPRRIIRCLDHFGVNFDRVVVERRLCAYYLFIGVIDNAIDSGQAQVSHIVLSQFEAKARRCVNSTSISDTALVTEKLKSEIPDESCPEVLAALHALNAAVEHERTATSIAVYIEARKCVGQLTAKASFLLIRPLLRIESSHVCRFMERVGEIGCLIDSVIDFDVDGRRGLLNFQNTTRAFLQLLIHTVKRGVSLSIEYPQLFGLFLEAVADNVLDRFRTRAQAPRPRTVTERTLTIDASPTV